jgi:hypothetical protein
VSYPYQAVNHDASIQATKVIESDLDGEYEMVQVMIATGNKSHKITMWLEDFERMARDILGGS